MDNQVNSEEKKNSWIPAFIVVAVIFGMVGIPTNAQIPLLPLLKEDLEMSFNQYGLFTGMPGIMALVLALPAGIAIQKFGTKKLMIPATILVCVGIAGIGLSPNFAMALTARGVWQVGLRFAVPAATAAIGVIVPDNQRTFALSCLSAVGMVAAVIIMNISTSISVSSGWQYSFYFMGAVTAVTVVAAFLMKNDAPEKKDAAGKAETEAKAETKPTGTHPYKIPGMWLLCILIICFLGIGLVESYAYLQMGELWGATETYTTKISSIAMLLSIILSLVFGKLADKMGKWNALLFLALINCSVCVLLIVGQNGFKMAYILGIVIAKSFYLLPLTVVNSLAPSLLGGRDVGPIVAMVGLGQGLGQFVGPQVLGTLNQMTNSYTAGWVYLLVTCVLAIILILFLQKYFNKMVAAEQQIADSAKC